MKKLYVDEILKNNKNITPGPDSYEKSPAFGVATKGSGHYSMRPLNDPFVQQLEK